MKTNNELVEETREKIDQIFRDGDKRLEEIRKDMDKEFKRQAKVAICAGLCFVVLWVGVILWVVL